MDFSTAIKTVLSKYMEFTGRASRPELWFWVLGVAILSVIMAIVEGAFLAPAMGFPAFSSDAVQPLRLLTSLAIFLPSIAVAVRRLHDIDRSGWWLLLQLVPIVGALVLLWWYVQPGTDGPNQYG